MNDRRIVLVVHNVRSAHNVGSILRTADGFAVEEVFFTGYTPYPKMTNDKRLPHVIDRAEKQIGKTALGADKTVKWRHYDNVAKLLTHLNKSGFMLVALEQTAKAISLPEFRPPGSVALIVGSEIGGIDEKLIELADTSVEIPMSGKKESFNVSVAAAVAIYHLRTSSK